MNQNGGYRTALQPLYEDEHAVGRTAANRGVLAYHVIFGAYGFWLPNDPRGSWSDFVAAWELFRTGGPATKITTRRSVAGVRHEVQARLDVTEALKYPPVVFDGYQALSIARGFQRMAEKSGYGVYACAILSEHVHMVLRRHTYKVEQMVRLLKAEASIKLMEDGRHPFADRPLKDRSLPSPWAHDCWKVFLDSDEAIDHAVCYTDGNPEKEGKRRQRWPFVIPYV